MAQSHSATTSTVITVRPLRASRGGAPISSNPASGRAYGERQRMVRLLHGESEAGALAPIYWAQVHGLACLIVDGPAGQQWPGVRERRRFMRDSLTHFARYMLGEPLPS